MIKIHDFAAMFPMAAESELLEMANDIRQRGLICPIITLDGKVLDGRNRLAACEIAEVTPRFQPYSGSDPLADVVSWNLKRRHLSPSQLAALAVELKPMFEERAKERMAEGGRDKGMANLPYPPLDKGTARDQAAAAVGVSGRTVQDAENVRKESPEMFGEVKAGRMTVNAAKNALQKNTPVMSRKQAESMNPCMGMKFARLAIGQLELIKDNDEERNKAFASVEEWIKNHETNA
jgi:hypothetical protein